MRGRAEVVLDEEARAERTLRRCLSEDEPLWLTDFTDVEDDARPVRLNQERTTVKDLSKDRPSAFPT